MKFDDWLDLMRQIDALSDKEFEAFYKFMLIRAMGRQLRRKSPPKSPPRGELKDCDPGTKRQGAAPKSL